MLASQLSDCRVVDNYIEKIEERGYVALGHYGTYVGNMQAAIGRFEAERLAGKDDPANIIVCGSIVETAVYEAINAFTMAAVASDPQQRQQFDARTGATMTWFGMFAFDTWDADVVLHLPLHDESDHWKTKVDDSIEEAAEAFGIHYETLKTATADDKLAEALEFITAAKERENDEAGESASEVDGLAVDNRGEEVSST